PHLSAEADRIVRTVCARLGPEFTVQAGKCVFEIRPAAWTKGAAVRAFMQRAPFLNRRPIYIGDDLTDEDGFAVVNELDGISIRVGDGYVTRARHRFPGVRHVVRWLESAEWPELAPNPS
ncbi:MAG: trehalose-phosphatase, partial [Steroidobacteraceae bacterium]